MIGNYFSCYLSCCFILFLTPTTSSLDFLGLGSGENCKVTVNKCSEKITQNSFTLPKTLKPQPLSKWEKFKFSFHKEEIQRCKKYFDKNSFQITLEQKELDCNFTQQFNIPFANNVTADSKLVNKDHFTHLGYFKKGNTLLSPNEYCISVLQNNTNPGILGIKTCTTNPSTSSNLIKVNKCCPQGSVMKLNVRRPGVKECVDVDESVSGSDTWYPFLYKHVGPGRFAEIEVQENAPGYLNMETKLLECNRTGIRTPRRDAVGHGRAQIRVTESGVIYTRKSGNHKWIKEKSSKNGVAIMCIDGLLDTYRNTTMEFERREENQVLIYCDDHVSLRGISTLAFVHITMMLLCCVFLITVVVVYTLVWDKQNIHGWTVATYSFCMLTFLILKVTADCYRIRNQHDRDAFFRIGSTSCYTIAVFIHFFFISLFSWMTVINVDLWMTLRPVPPIKGRRAEKRRFLFYTTFGFGIPLIVVCISLFVDNHFDLFDDTVIRPQYGHSKCGLDKTALLYYEVIVTLILFGSSILLSCVTLNFINAFIKQTNRLQQDVIPSARNNMTMLLVKLFVLLAFSWIFEIAGILWSFLSLTNRWYVVLFDIHNFIQSVGFFVIFVIKKEIKQQLRIKFTLFDELFCWFEERFPSHSESWNTNLQT